MESIVIKVRYGEMLRRFSVRVYENGRLDLYMNGLRAKVVDFFNFSSGTDFTLTYVDEDGDVVNLVNDDDLHEMMTQQLKFLRIDVHLKNKEKDQSQDRSDGSSTPMTSERSFQNVCTGISDVLKSLPEPLPEFCSQLIIDIASKAVTSPVLSELAQSFRRLGDTHPHTGSQASSVPETSTQNVATECSTPPLDADAKASKNDGFRQESGSKFQCAGSSHKDRKISNSESVTKNIGVSAPVVGLDEFLFEKPAVTARCSSISFNGEEKEKHNDAFLDPLKEMQVSDLPASTVGNSHYSPATYMDGRLVNECPFSGIPFAPRQSMLGTVGINPVSSRNGYSESAGSMFHKGPIVNNSSYIDALHEGSITSSRGCVGSVGSSFHKGIICDGCGAHPITGPRFKSQVKDNYDLCSICFAKIGNEADYIRIDRPVSCRHPRMKGFNRRYPFSGPRFETLGSLTKQTKLDSRFVADVNVFDGTVMAPNTSFTKIWRLLNSGTSNWPRGTLLVWTGGDKLSRSLSVQVQVPADGLPLGQEIEIAVDLTSPSFPGQFTSYWSLVSPSGHKFGQRVWVLIQVDEAHGMPDSNYSQALDLNLPPILIDRAHEGEKKNTTPAVSDDVLFPHDEYISVGVGEMVEPDRNLSVRDQDIQLLLNQGIIVGESPATSAKEDNLGLSCSAIDPHGVLTCSTKVPPGSCPFIDFPVPIPPPNLPPIPSPKVSPAPSENVTANNVVEETLLKTLEDMGFKQVNLNKEVLKRNEYNLEQSVDELCGVSEWDPILDELEDMGFVDKEMNKRLLKKNNGSMKQVVMELLYGEKA